MARDTLEHTMRKVVSFRDVRDWKRFHSPRNLATALAIEAAELQETMLWKTDSEVVGLLKKAKSKAEITAEIGDIFIFALLFCDAAQIDPLAAIHKKLKVNSAKYPVHLSRGRSTKYTQLRRRTGN